jgi:gamma-glutamyltranspeptidase/glutathione hydrolase
MRSIQTSLLCLILLFFFSHPVYTSEKSHSAAIASAHPLATEAGHQILKSGGNAFDAAVTVSAVLAVVEPYSSGLGGGGFWLLHRANDGHQVMIDGRERAPLAAHRDLFLDEEGNVIPLLSINGALSAGIPGTPAALAHLAKHYGKLPLADLLQPAIDIATNGFPANDYYRALAAWRLPLLQAFPATAAQFLQAGEVPESGYLIKQPELANTLQTIADKGAAGFYHGEIAQNLVAGVNAAGGIWSLEDLAQYQVVERKPVTGEYQGFKITSASPPSSGGVALITMFNILQSLNYSQLQEPQRTHVTIEAMRRAFRDRARYLGDPDYWNVPTNILIHPWYGAILAWDISLDLATPSTHRHQSGEPKEGNDTTHFSIIDQEGNRVAATLSINYPFGSGLVAPGTGVLLNDEMDDFSAHPGTPNVYGLIGSEANAIEPGKRMLSSMSPTFIEDKKHIAILGTPGGSKIITMVLLGLLDMTEGNGPESWVSRPRYHHQYLPDQVQYEEGAFSGTLQAQLMGMGHNLQPADRPFGNMQAILLHKHSGAIEAASDPRGIGSAKIEP